MMAAVSTVLEVRDVRKKFREQARQMLIDCGTPRVRDASNL